MKNPRMNCTGYWRFDGTDRPVVAFDWVISGHFLVRD